MSTDLGRTFERIYDEGVWGTGSGPGSAPDVVAPYLTYVQSLLNARQIRSIVDCGCGDWQSTHLLDLDGIDYLGIDIVPSVVEANRERHGRPGIGFEHGDFAAIDLPPADLLICKDVLQHLDDEHVLALLRQMHKYRYVLITNDIGDNVERNFVRRSNVYSFAELDVTRPPFAVRAREVCRMAGGTKVTHLVEDTAQEVAYRPAWTADADHARDDDPPTVLLAILAKQKEAVLPLYLACIEALDYPKDRVGLWVRTNNNTDGTEGILRSWLSRVGHSYRRVWFDTADVGEKVEQFGVHEWNRTRFGVLGAIRQESLDAAARHGFDFYFVSDVDNFVVPNTLRSLVALDLPICAPLLRHVDPSVAYSNYHHATDANGYFAPSALYDELLLRRVRGAVEVDVAHCTYLVRADAAGPLRYDDGSGRHEYVVFSDSARRHNVRQYLDTRQVYGYLTLDESPAAAEALVGLAVRAALGPGAGEPTEGTTAQ